MIEDPKELWFYFSVYFIKVYLIYNVFIFAEQQGDSVTYIYIHTHTSSYSFPLWFIQDIEYSSLCYTVGPCFLSIPCITLSCLCSNLSVMSDSLRPCGLWQPTRLLCPRNFSGKNPGVGCRFLLQGILPTQRLNLRLLRLLHCRWILYLRSHWGSLYNSLQPANPKLPIHPSRVQLRASQNIFSSHPMYFHTPQNDFKCTSHFVIQIKACAHKD